MPTILDDLNRRWPGRSWLHASSEPAAPPLHELLLELPGVIGRRTDDGTPVVSFTAVAMLGAETIAALGRRRVYWGPRVVTRPFTDDAPLAVVREIGPRAWTPEPLGGQREARSMAPVPDSPDADADMREAAGILRWAGWTAAHAGFLNGLPFVSFGPGDIAVTTKQLHRAVAYLPKAEAGSKAIPSESVIRDRRPNPMPESWSQAARAVYAAASQEGWAPPRDETRIEPFATLVGVSGSFLDRRRRPAEPRPVLELVLDLTASPSRRSGLSRYSSVEQLWVEYA